MVMKLLFQVYYNYYICGWRWSDLRRAFPSLACGIKISIGEQPEKSCTFFGRSRREERSRRNSSEATREERAASTLRIVSVCHSCCSFYPSPLLLHLRAVPPVLFLPFEKKLAEPASRSQLVRYPVPVQARYSGLA